MRLGARNSWCCVCNNEPFFLRGPWRLCGAADRCRAGSTLGHVWAAFLTRSLCA